MKEKSFDRKNELLAAALEEFCAREYKDASLNTIIKNAGISKGTFYYHFKDKEALYLYLLESTVEVKMDFLNSRMQEDHYDPKEIGLFKTFEIQAKLGLEFAKEYPEYYQLGIRFIKEKGNQIYETGMELLGGSAVRIFDQMVDQAIQNNEFQSDYPAEFIRIVIRHFMIHFNEIFGLGEDMDLKEAMINLENALKFLKRGLGKGEDV